MSSSHRSTPAASPLSVAVTTTAATSSAHPPSPSTTSLSRHPMTAQLHGSHRLQQHYMHQQALVGDPYPPPQFSAASAALPFTSKQKITQQPSVGGGTETTADHSPRSSVLAHSAARPIDSRHQQQHNGEYAQVDNLKCKPSSSALPRQNRSRATSSRHDRFRKDKGWQTGSKHAEEERDANTFETEEPVGAKDDFPPTFWKSTVNSFCSIRILAALLCAVFIIITAICLLRHHLHLLHERRAGHRGAARRLHRGKG